MNWYLEKLDALKRLDLNYATNFQNVEGAFLLFPKKIIQSHIYY